MATLRELVVKLGVDANTRKVAAFDKALDRVKSGMGRLVGFAVRATSALGVFTAALGARQVVETITTYERLREQLRTVIGDADRAGQAFGELTDFAAKTPFQLEGITEAFIRMQAVGLKPTITDMRDVGDFAASFGKDITEFADAVVAATTGENERLKQFGVVARTEGDKVRFTYDGITKTIKKDSQEIKKFLLDMARTRFAGSMERQSRTLGGAISTLRDNISLLIFRVGEAGLRSELTKLVQDLTGMTQSAEDAADVIGAKLAGAVAGLRRSLPEIRNSIVDVVQSIERFVALAGGIENIVAALQGAATAAVALKGLTILSSLIPLIEGIAAVLGGVTLAALGEFVAIALVAAAVVIALTFAIQDLITFFQGGDSALGRFIEKFQGTNTIAGKTIALFERVADLVMDVGTVALPLLADALGIVFRFWTIQMRFAAKVLAFLFEEVAIPMANNWLNNTLMILDLVRSAFDAMGIDVVQVFEDIIGAINEAFDWLERFLGIANVDLGTVAPGLAGAPNGAPSPGPGGGDVGAMLAEGRLLESLSMGGDTNNFQIDATGMDEKQLADELEKRLDNRDKKRLRNARERFRGREA